jgi:glycosyltransferase involved in cell wall biosynthesis
LVPWLKQNADKYDIIVINGLWNYLSLGAWRGLRKSKVPYFVYTHGMLDPWFKQKYPLKHAAKQLFWFFSEGQLLRHAKAVLFTSEEERRLARNAFYPYKVASEVVVGYGTADPPADDGTAKRAFYAQFPLLLEKPFILFLGRLHPKKGCDILIKAFHRVQDRFPYDLVFAGPDQVGWKEELASLAKDLNLSDRIHWTGMLAGDQKWGALRSCEAFILPSHQENFGVAVAEALACGKEVLITNKVNIWREVEQSGVGLVEEDTEQGIVNLLENFLERNKTRISASNHARQVFLSEFALATSTRRLVEVFGS